MGLKTEWKPMLWIMGAFIVLYSMPVEDIAFQRAVQESLMLTRWYAREHVLLCLVPAFFIAGGISVFLKQEAVMHYLGPGAPRILSYGVASVSGTILAVCSCTVLPLFAGIYSMGAGIGPASAFLYSGPAINVLAVILTARVLGPELGIARAVGAVVFAIIIGLIMALLFRKTERNRVPAESSEAAETRPLIQNILFFVSMVAILIFANWGRPSTDTGIWASIYTCKWLLTGISAIGLGAILTGWFHVRLWKILLAGIVTATVSWGFPHVPEAGFAVGLTGLVLSLASTPGEMVQWLDETWTFTKQIMPLLLIGVLLAGLALGRPGHEGLIPSGWISSMVGENSIGANLFASVAGAFMYFATLTEVPILEGLIGNGMASGPALALLLAGPALSLPNMLVIHSIIGFKRTAAFTLLVILMATLTGLLAGIFI